MTINFIATELYYIAGQLTKEKNLASILPYHNKMRDAVQAQQPADTDDVALDIEPVWISSVWNILSKREEGVSSQMNNQIANSIFTQVMTIVGGQPNGGQIDTQVENLDENGFGDGTYTTVTTYTPERGLLNEMQAKQAAITTGVSNLIATGKGVLNS